MNKGEAVTLPCHVAPGDVVTWIQVQRPDSHFFYIYQNGKIRYQGMRHRYSVPNAASGDNTMIIKNIQPNDAGRYFCIRGNFSENPIYVTEPAFLHDNSLRIYIVYVTGKMYKQFVTVISYVLIIFLISSWWGIVFVCVCLFVSKVTENDWRLSSSDFQNRLEWLFDCGIKFWATQGRATYPNQGYHE